MIQTLVNVLAVIGGVTVVCALAFLVLLVEARAIDAAYLHDDPPEPRTTRRRLNGDR